MENSNCGCECSFVKSGFCKTDKECPFYVETWWQKEGVPDPKLIKDCFPKKFALEQNHLLHRQLCMQSVMEGVRNRMDRIETMLTMLISQSKEFLNQKNEPALRCSDINLKEIETNKDQNDNS